MDTFPDSKGHVRAVSVKIESRRVERQVTKCRVLIYKYRIFGSISILNFF